MISYTSLQNEEKVILGRAKFFVPPALEFCFICDERGLPAKCPHPVTRNNSQCSSSCEVYRQHLANAPTVKDYFQPSRLKGGYL